MESMEVEPEEVVLQPMGSWPTNISVRTPLVERMMKVMNHPGRIISIANYGSLSEARRRMREMMFKNKVVDGEMVKVPKDPPPGTEWDDWDIKAGWAETNGERRAHLAVRYKGEKK